jgi:hypothetical protein
VFIKIKIGGFMFKRLLLGITAVSALALLSTETNAATCLQYRNVGGSRMCVKWSPGSEICNVQVQGLTSADFPGGEGGEPSITCEVRAVTTGGTIPGTAFCVPTGTTVISAAKTTANDVCRHHFNGVGTGHLHHEDDCQAVEATIADGTIPPESTGLTQCDAKGVCKTFLELDPDTCPDCCPAGFDFVTFTADQFRGITDLCIPGEEGCHTLELICTLQGGNYQCTEALSLPPVD